MVDSSQPIPSGTGTKKLCIYLDDVGQDMCTAVISVSTQEKEQKFMLDSKGRGEGGMVEGDREGRGKCCKRAERLITSDVE